jgi:proteasome-associated ATPase
MLGKAVATAVGSQGGFISVKGPEILDPYVGVSEANVRALFRHAEEWKAKSGKPAVVFVDEAEAILATRGGHHNYMGQTIVPTFLTEMQGLEESSAIVILATNRPDILDPAVIRDGRIDAKIEVPRPNEEEAVEILSIHIDSLPLGRGIQKPYLAKTVAEDLYGGPEMPFSGALLAGLVEKASQFAIRRDIASGARRPSGLCPGDFAKAVVTVQNQEEPLAA